MQNFEGQAKSNIDLKHKISLDNRENLMMTGVIKVENINTEIINCKLNGSNICITGKDLHIAKLDVNTGEVLLVGQIECIKYAGEKQSFFKRIFK